MQRRMGLDIQIRQIRVTLERQEAPEHLRPRLVKKLLSLLEQRQRRNGESSSTTEYMGRGGRLTRYDP